MPDEEKVEDVKAEEPVVHLTAQPLVMGTNIVQDDDGEE